jgi:hypothetical protein
VDSSSVDLPLVVWLCSPNCTAQRIQCVSPVRVMVVVCLAHERSSCVRRHWLDRLKRLSPAVIVSMSSASSASLNQDEQWFFHTGSAAILHIFSGDDGHTGATCRGRRCRPCAPARGASQLPARPPTGAFCWPAAFWRLAGMPFPPGRI